MSFDKSINERLRGLDTAKQSLADNAVRKVLANQTNDPAAWRQADISMDSAITDIKMSSWIHAGSNCFHCGKDIEPDTRPFIWKGYAGEGPNANSHTLTMHPACLLDWAARLSHDLENAKRIVAGLQPIGRGVAK